MKTLYRNKVERDDAGYRARVKIKSRGYSNADVAAGMARCKSRLKHAGVVTLTVLEIACNARPVVSYRV